MDKEALLSIILSDISEIETLIKSFQGQANIPNAFIDLTERKVNHLAEELHMLKALGADTTESKPKEIIEPIETKQPEITKPIIETTIVKEAKVETPSLEKTEPVFNEAIVNDQQEEKAASVVADEIIEEKPVATNTVVEVVKETPAIEKEPIIEAPTQKEVVVEKPAAVEVKVELEKEVTTEAAETKAEQQNNLRLGETLQKGKKALNDQVTHTEISKKVLGKPVADLSKGLGINDRFLYQRELFNGNASLMSDTLGQLNAMDSFESAVSFLKSNFNWENEELSNNFFNYVQRRF